MISADDTCPLSSPVFSSPDHHMSRSEPRSFLSTAPALVREYHENRKLCLEIFCGSGPILLFPVLFQYYSCTISVLFKYNFSNIPVLFQYYPITTGLALRLYWNSTGMILKLYWNGIDVDTGMIAK